MNQERIGKFIAESRKEQGMTQQQLADIIGVSSKTVSKWECGNGMPELSSQMETSITMPMRLASAFN